MQYGDKHDNAMRTCSQDALTYDLLKAYNTVQSAEDNFNVAKDYVKAAQLLHVKSVLSC